MLVMCLPLPKDYCENTNKQGCKAGKLLQNWHYRIYNINSASTSGASASNAWSGYTQTEPGSADLTWTAFIS